MKNAERIAVKLIFNTLIDKNEHNLYEFHTRYRLPPAYILTAVNFLIKHEIAILNEKKISLSIELDNKKIAIINKISKTEKPKILSNNELDT